MPQASPAAYASPAERSARGKQARTAVPRSSHAAWTPPADRPDPVDLLEQQARSRTAELVPIRYGRMLASPFAFFRGGALIMATDLAATPQSGLTAQLCGDAHLSNFGVFGSPERQLMFDINDFDETLPGPWEWDLKRLAASFEIACRERGFTTTEARSIVLTCAAEYRERMAAAARLSTLDVWYAHIAVEDLMSRLDASSPPGLSKEERRRQKRRAERGLAKTKQRDSLHSLAKLTHEVDGGRRIVADPPLLVPISDLAPSDMTPEQLMTSMQSLLRSYRRTLETDRQHLLDEFHLVDMAHKVVGVGSVGTQAWILLLLGRDDTDPLLLQAKQAQHSALESVLPRSRYRNHAQRVVAGQRLMQAASDIFLGWQRVSGPDGVHRDFYVRQLRDWKASVDVTTLTVPLMTLYARLCGATLARAHARSGDRIAIAAYAGTGQVLDRAIADFASAYADQNERDYEALVAAVHSGRLVARVGL